MYRKRKKNITGKKNNLEVKAKSNGIYFYTSEKSYEKNSVFYEGMDERTGITANVSCMLTAAEIIIIIFEKKAHVFSFLVSRHL